MTELYTPEYFFELFTKNASDLGLTPYTIERCEEIAKLFNRIVSLIKQYKIALLVHNYQLHEVQELVSATGGYIGDSYGLALKAQETKQDALVCAVEFMGETIKLLAPNSKVLLPARGSCSLVESVQEKKLMRWKRNTPNGKVISYINTLARTKALSDYICTSRNASKIVKKVRELFPDSPILFMPDMFLGQVVASDLGINIEFSSPLKLLQTGFHISADKKFYLWPGSCYIHEQLTTRKIEDAWIEQREKNPAKKVQVLLHPECGCTSSCMTSSFWKDSGARYESTEGMLRIVKSSDADIFVAGTETEMTYRLRSEAPNKIIVPVSTNTHCKHMKVITLENILHCLENINDPQFEVNIPDDTAKEALTATNKMIEIGQ